MDFYGKTEHLQFPLRINIHFCLDVILKSEVEKLNSSLAELGSEINFMKYHVPHITVVMGIVKNSHDLDKIKNRVLRFCFDQPEFKISLSQPYKVKPKNQFVFLDTLPQEAIKKIKENLYNHIYKWIKTDYHGKPTNHSHITIGYFSRPSQEVQEVVANLKLVIPKSRIKEIGISEASHLGTCLKEFYRFNLGGYQKEPIGWFEKLTSYSKKIFPEVW